jgi:hypothetical protein
MTWLSVCPELDSGTTMPARHDEGKLISELVRIKDALEHVHRSLNHDGICPVECRIALEKGVVNSGASPGSAGRLAWERGYLARVVSLAGWKPALPGDWRPWQ